MGSSLLKARWYGRAFFASSAVGLCVKTIFGADGSPCEACRCLDRGGVGTPLYVYRSRRCGAGARVGTALVARDL